MNKRSKLLALVGAGFLTFGVAGVALASAPTGHVITICHADGGSGNFSSIPVDIASAGYPDASDSNSHAAHENDIIPAYHYDIPGGGSFDYAGLNWDAEGQAIYNSGECNGIFVPPTDTPAPPPTDTPPPGGGGGDITLAPTDAFGTTGTSSSDGAWLLVVALGVLLASIVVLTPARAKSRR